MITLRRFRVPVRRLQGRDERAHMHVALRQGGLDVVGAQGIMDPEAQLMVHGYPVSEFLHKHPYLEFDGAFRKADDQPRPAPDPP
jgi:hypothetical protein